MFEFSAGSPSLCLVDTIGGRGRADIERLGNPRDLVRWLGAAGWSMVEKQEASEAELRDARAVRDALYGAAVASLDGAAPDKADIDTINTIARGAPFRPQWRNGGIDRLADDPIRAALSELAADGIAVLAPPLVQRVRACPECRMIFLDRSPAGRRRWCASASGCGNRAKVRNHRARQSSKESSI